MLKLRIVDIGHAPYGPTLELQKQLVEKVKKNRDSRAYCIFVEHDPPVITVGRGGSEENVLLSPQMLESQGFELFRSSRGGDVTYHGPGQIVGYPIFPVDLLGKDVHRFLRDIEEVIIRVIAGYGIQGDRKEGLTGVWVGNEKVAATGIAMTKWVSWHGFALNVCPNLSHFQTIVPCGIRDKGVTSLKELLGHDVSLPDIKEALKKSMIDIFGFYGWMEENRTLPNASEN